MRADRIRHALLRGTFAMLIALGVAGCDSHREPEAVGGPPLVRRLTESQYRATVADVFGADIPVAARFENGLRTEGLIAIGTSLSGMSPFSLEQYDAAALGVAAAVVSEPHHKTLVPCAPADDKQFDDACAQRFVSQYGERLFRRPLTQDEVQRFVGAARAGHAQLGSFYSGLEFALAGILLSPDFLLRIERVSADHDGDTRTLDAYSKATRLAYFLTNSTPDDELLRAAGAGDLDSQRGLKRQVDRLIASPKFEQAVRAFFVDMLEFDKFGSLAKDPTVYPAFNTTLAADAQEQTLKTISDLLIAQNGDYRDIFTTRKAFLTRPLGVVYQVPVPTRDGWDVSEFPERTHRAGVQSHVAFLALHSHPGRSSPTLRGAAAREVFLCQEVPDPPANVNFAVVQDPSNKAMPTARDRLEAHRTNPSCAGCHKVMDPLGLTLENFDGVGRFRTTENGVRIDSSGSLDGFDFTTPEGVAKALHDHPETSRCLVEKLYRFAVGRDTRIEERPYMDYLIQTFKTDGYRVPELMRSIALSRNFFTVSPQSPVEPDAEPRPLASSHSAVIGERS